MKRLSNFLLSSLVILMGMMGSATGGYAHHPPELKLCKRGAAVQASRTTMPAAVPLPNSTSGQGKWKFKVLYTASHLPAAAVKVLVKAHGGFAVDRRKEKGETYFALPGAGILKISADLKNVDLLDTPADVKDHNQHNATVWYGENGAAYLTFPSNQTAQVFTTTLGGKLVHTLNAPTAEHDFSHPTVNEYFDQGNGFVPTDVEQLDGLFYITTGYSKLDYVLTARILSLEPFQAVWYDLVFGGKGEAAGRFGTGHGITVPPGTKRIDVADRPNSEVDRFTRHGHYRSTLKLPEGSFPCDIDYIGNTGIVGCLHGPDRSKGAPVYILEGDEVVSTVMPKEELGLENFQHIHNAVFRKIGGKHYIIVQAWNPGDFAILEQVTE